MQLSEALLPKRKAGAQERYTKFYVVPKESWSRFEFL